MVETGKNAVMSTDKWDAWIVSRQLFRLPLNLIQFLANAITTNVPILLQKGYELLSNLVDGFVKAIPEALPGLLILYKESETNLQRQPL